MLFCFYQLTVLLFRPRNTRFARITSGAEHYDIYAIIIARHTFTPFSYSSQRSQPAKILGYKTKKNITDQVNLILISIIYILD